MAAQHTRSQAGLKAAVPALAFMMACAVTSIAQAQPTGVTGLPVLERILPDPAVQGDFQGKKRKDRAQDLSGIACRALGPGLDCLVVDDQGAVAQRAAITGNTIVAGDVVSLIGDDPPNNAFGMKPNVECPKKAGKFKEFDGEGVAYSDGFFYVVGSHGCGRNSGKFNSSSFLVARIGSATSGALGPIALSWRLSEALSTAEHVRDAFGKDLMTANGLNIEGIAVAGERLLIGLRGPSRAGTAYVVSASAAALFSGAAPLDARTIPLTLGQDVGIRDLATLADGRVLILSGPAQEQTKVPFGLFLLAGTTLTPLGRLDEVSTGGKRAKAEAVTVLAQDGKVLRVLVLSDGLPNGGARSYRVRLPG